MTPRIRIILADDHQLVRTGIRRILEAQPEFEVLAEAATGSEACALVAERRPDVLVLDLTMPGGDGIEVLRAVRASHAPIKVVVLTMHAGREYVANAVKEGADAYLLKDSAVQDLVAAIRAVVGGRRYFSPAVQEIMADWLAGGPPLSAADSLTDREREVLAWLARGLSSKAVAEQLGIGVRTVETHRANVMHKLGVKSVATLIQVALREGLIAPNP